MKIIEKDADSASPDARENIAEANRGEPGMAILIAGIFSVGMVMGMIIGYFIGRAH